jgi:hydroxyacylglutathione hydrolase
MLGAHPIPAFSDNYIWCLSRGDQAWVVDPGEAAPVLAHLQASGLALAGILITHHHFDHTGGVAELLERWPDLPVIGPSHSPFAGATQTVADGDQITVFDVRFDVLAVPGHTLDHIAYHAPDEAMLLCGDTLFAGGCGRIFEGDVTMMHQSLQRLAALPGSTRVYCAHEYTVANLAFAQAVEPDNKALRRRIAVVAALRAEGRPSVPSRLDEELATNPFLRGHIPSVQRAALERGAQHTTPEAVFGAIRAWKNEF